MMVRFFLLGIFFLTPGMFCHTLYAFGNGTEIQTPGISVGTAPEILENVGIEEHLGETLDLSLMFRDETGSVLPLRNFFHEDKPVVLALVYYSCPSMCNLLLNGMTDTLKNLEWNAGNQFHVVVVSIDPTETPQLAKLKRESYLANYARFQAEKGWHFLTGDQDNITRLTKAVGFKYRYDEKKSEYVHAAATYVITPAGKISYYHYGLKSDPKVLRLSLVEASENRIGTVMDRIILFCLRYDPTKKGYAFYAMNIMRIAGGLFALGLAFFLGMFWYQQRRPSTLKG
ncbi:MAG: SCO family protein [Bdellovibrio sp.]|nr:SCO family protein [Bdellovibrio sp.]